jgi:mono/diheme cytochrome c family protein
VTQPTVAASAPPPPGTRSYRWVAAPLLAFALFSLTAGLLAKHDPRSKGYFRLFFSDPVHLKAWFATAAAALALTQLVTAAWIFRKLPWPKPAWVNPVHRISGVLAFAFTLPVAYHCIFKLGFQHTSSRVLAHSLLGSAVYGGYAAKVTIIRLHRFPRPVLPLAGGLLFAALIGVWYTSAVWLFEQDHKAKAAPPARTTPVGPPQGDVANGKKVFASAGCGACHTFSPAGSSGAIGPNLDTTALDFARIKRQVENGSGVMPSFKGKLSVTQIRDVAAFVAAGP